MLSSRTRSSKRPAGQGLIELQLPFVKLLVAEVSKSTRKPLPIAEPFALQNSGYDFVDSTVSCVGLFGAGDVEVVFALSAWSEFVEGLGQFVVVR